MGLTELKYALTAFRTQKTYLILLIAQLVLSLAIVLVALTSKTHFRTPLVLSLELVLFLSLAFDLLVIRWISEGRLCHRKTNIFDLCLLCVFAATLLFLFVSSYNDESKDYRKLLQLDDVLVIALVISRYAVQVLRLVNQIRHTHINRKIQHEIKKVDLNAQQFNHSINLDTVQIDKHVRNRITSPLQKNQLVEQFDS